MGALGGERAASVLLPYMTSDAKWRRKAATFALSANALSSAAARCSRQWASHSSHSSAVKLSRTQPFQRHVAHQIWPSSKQNLKTSASSKPFSVGT